MCKKEVDFSIGLCTSLHSVNTDKQRTNPVNDDMARAKKKES